MNRDPAVAVVRREALWFEPTADGMAPLLDAVGDAHLVLIGEATHGSSRKSRSAAAKSGPAPSIRNPEGM